MIYLINAYNEPTITYFVEDQAAADLVSSNPYIVANVLVGTKADAEALLAQKQQKILRDEETRFHVGATFVVGNDHIWRSIEDTDPEDTVCQVFDHYTGKYIECANKTEGYARNEQVKQEFLASIRMDKVYEIETIEPASAVIAKQNNQIPVEKL